MTKNKKEKIPDNFKTIEEASNFWDTHDLGDYWEQTKEVKCNVNIKYRKNYIAVEKYLMDKISEIAIERGVSPETLINLWLEEKIVSPVPPENSIRV